MRAYITYNSAVTAEILLRMELTATDKGVTRFVTVDNDILYNRTLQDVIALKKDIVLDFTSLKACLDPQRDGGLEVSAAHAHYVLLDPKLFDI